MAAACPDRCSPRRVIHRGYRFDIEPADKHVRVEVAGNILAESDRVLVMHETRLAPVHYVPAEDVRGDLLVPSDYRSHCPFKGNATYWHIKTGERLIENAVWSYLDPFEEASSIGGYRAFFRDRIDAWYEDGVRILHQEQPASGGSRLVDWLMREAPHAKTPEELVDGLARKLVAVGMPLWRMRVLIRTLNPQVLGSFYTWRSDTDEIDIMRPSHAVLERPDFLSSPFAPVLNGEGGIRRRLDIADATFDFPVLVELKKEGATDYVAMPLTFSNGQINIITMVSREPGGFTTDDLGALYEALPMIARLLEVHALHNTAVSLLDTYIGHKTGSRVLDGQIRRGDGEDIHAVIWFSDLRGSSQLSEALPRDAYLALLNDFFEAMAGAVQDNGGEVLKFIGDAVLAIFPITDPDNLHPRACGKALRAAHDAVKRIDAVNAERGEAGDATFGYGIGLHRGDLTYGNVGSADRLDFTVIGPAVNAASRIQDQARTIGEQVVLSDVFARGFVGELRSLGHHSLRGIEESRELFALPPDIADESAAA